MKTSLFASLCALLIAAGGLGGFAEDQKRQYEADGPKTVLELQQFRESVSGSIKSRAGRAGVATLVNLNPAINSWYLLQVAWKDGATDPAAHLENAKPHDAKLLLDDKYPSGIIVQEGNNRFPCDLFGAAVIDQARHSPLAYYPLCEGRVYLRNPSKGHRSTLESTVEFLRDRVWGGEEVITVFHHLLADRYRETGELEPTRTTLQTPGGGTAEQPPAATIDPQYAGRRLIPREMGLGLEREGPEKDGMVAGNWYAGANPGTWVSVIQPNVVAGPILQSYGNLVNALDKVEASSLCYLVAFDLDRFDLGYELGTEHPRVNWSDRVTVPMRDARMSGPDGIESIAPLVTVGLIRPDIGRKTVAAFIGGFKRTHGAFRTGDLAQRNHGSHYGFLENGVVLSKLQPGLSTVFVLADGSVAMKTWTEADNGMLNKVRHARQNGVPIIESGGTESPAGSAPPVPGRLVGRWGMGNWSGSEAEKERTMRSGLALATSHGRNFLIYAEFSDATPSAMARVFQAYRVNYAMLLDMNALEHTYLAVYRRSGGELAVDHLLKGMSVLDKLPSGELVPRFLGYSDNRDFFYLTFRGAKEEKR